MPGADLKGIQPVIIAQISDVHVRPAGLLYKNVADSSAMLTMAIAQLNVMQPRPDLVLISGDLVDQGDPAEYAALRDLLSMLSLPYRVIPGNHDERNALRSAFGDHAYLPALGPMHYAVEEYPVRIVALDSTVPGQHHGAVGEAGLAWLRRTLAADTSRQVMLMLHHPPIATGIPYLDIYGLHDAEALAAVVADFPNIERVLCGHVHRSMQARWAGTLVMTCPSTVTQIALRTDRQAPPASYLEPPGFLLHVWQPGQGMLTHLVPIGEFPGPFPFA